jgi:hypothetical protein
MRAVAIKKGQSREKQWVCKKWAPFGVMVAAKSSLSFTSQLWSIKGSLKNRLLGSKKFLRTITSATRSIPTESNCPKVHETNESGIPAREWSARYPQSGEKLGQLSGVTLSTQEPVSAGIRVSTLSNYRLRTLEMVGFGCPNHNLQGQ